MNHSLEARRKDLFVLPHSSTSILSVSFCLSSQVLSFSSALLISRGAQLLLLLHTLVSLSFLFSCPVCPSSSALSLSVCLSVCLCMLAVLVYCLCLSAEIAHCALEGGEWIWGLNGRDYISLAALRLLRGRSPVLVPALTQIPQSCASPW